MRAATAACRDRRGLCRAEFARLAEAVTPFWLHKELIMTTLTGQARLTNSAAYEQVWQAERQACRTDADPDTLTVGVVVVTRNPAFFQTGLSVLNDIRDYVFNRVHIQSEMPLKLLDLAADSLYLAAREKALHFLKGQNKAINVRIIQCASLAEATGKIIYTHALEQRPEFHLGMLFYDQTTPASMTASNRSIAIWTPFTAPCSAAAFPRFTPPSPPLRSFASCDRPSATCRSNTAKSCAAKIRRSSKPSCCACGWTSSR